MGRKDLADLLLAQLMKPSPFIEIWKEEEALRQAKRRLMRLGLNPPDLPPNYVTVSIGQFIKS